MKKLIEFILRLIIKLILIALYSFFRLVELVCGAIANMLSRQTDFKI